MASNYDLVSFLICDEGVILENGKELLVGVYNDEIIFGQLPARMPNICFRISVRLKRVDLNSAFFVVNDPNGMQIIKSSYLVQHPTTKEQTIFLMNTRRPQFLVPGKYITAFGINEDPEQVGWFNVRAGEIGRMNVYA
jgi:hypothetical protein